MLVLTRKLHQRIVIGEGIEVTVLGLDGGRVRLGIDAPADVAVLREELRARNHEDKQAERSSNSEAISASKRKSGHPLKARQPIVRQGLAGRVVNR